MHIKGKIKSILQEAEIYRSQGLKAEAIQKYNAALDLISSNQQLKNKNRIQSAIKSKLNSLSGGKKTPEKNGSTPELSENVQDLIQNLFSFSENKGDDKAILEGAISLAKFGQIDRALEELNKLVKKDKVRVIAAKNVINCHLSVNSVDGAIAQYREWQASDFFPAKHLSTVRAYLEQCLKKKGIIAEIDEPADTLEPELFEDYPEDDGEDEYAENANEEVDNADEGYEDNADDGYEDDADDDDQEGEFLEIDSIGITFEEGPQKGTSVEFDVNFQSGNTLSLIIPDKEKALVESLDEGSNLNDIQFFSPIAIFKGTGVVSSRTMIKHGPKRGDICLDIKITNQ
ncbi:MAG: hypothetical protein HKM93_01420 [Desulfobacteraceae bacterium]|nr:hypothetical protein [Desulfobacteraceae bacterium]